MTVHFEVTGNPDVNVGPHWGSAACMLNRKGFHFQVYTVSSNVQLVTCKRCLSRPEVTGRYRFKKSELG